MDRKEEIKEEVYNWNKEDIEDLAEDLLSLVRAIEENKEVN